MLNYENMIFIPNERKQNYSKCELKRSSYKQNRIIIIFATR